MPRDAAGRHDTANQRDAKVRSAERRKCPSCQRKSAMVRVSLPERIAERAGSVSAYCRWCGFERRRNA